jgi:dienelactone hydrolase
MTRAVTCLVLLLAALAHAQPADPTQLRLVVPAPAAKGAKVERALPYRSVEGRALAVDVYRPAGSGAARPAPAVLLVSGAESVRDWGLYRDYGQLVAAQGLVALIPDKRYPRGEAGLAQGTEDTLALLGWVQQNARRLGVDPQRLCLWTFSAGGQLAGLALRTQPSLRCLVAYYGLGSGAARSALRAPEARLPPLLVVRAGRDSPQLNQGIDAFVSEALAVNAPLTLVNYPEGLHAFEVRDGRPEVRAPANVARTQALLAQTFAFLKAALR